MLGSGLLVSTNFVLRKVGYNPLKCSVDIPFLKRPQMTLGSTALVLGTGLSVNTIFVIINVGYNRLKCSLHNPFLKRPRTGLKIL